MTPAPEPHHHRRLPPPKTGAAFFPPAKEEAQLIETFSVFGAAFLARPLGGIIFGWIGDRRSKQFALQLSLFLMAISTTLMVRTYVRAYAYASASCIVCSVDRSIEFLL